MPDKILDLRNPQRDTPQAATPPQQKEGKAPFMLEWSAPEFPSRPKDSSSWMLGTGAVAVAVFLYFLFSKNFFGVFLLVVGTAVWLMYAFRPAREFTFRMTPRGVEVGTKLFSFESFSSFWIFYDPPELKEVRLRRKGTFSLDLVLPLADTDPVAVRRALLVFLPEEEQQYSALDLFLRRIGF